MTRFPIDADTQARIVAAIQADQNWKRYRNLRDRPPGMTWQDKVLLGCGLVVIWSVCVFAVWGFLR